MAPVASEEVVEGYHLSQPFWDHEIKVYAVLGGSPQLVNN